MMELEIRSGVMSRRILRILLSLFIVFMIGDTVLTLIAINNGYAEICSRLAADHPEIWAGTRGLLIGFVAIVIRAYRERMAYLMNIYLFAMVLVLMIVTVMNVTELINHGL